MKRRMFLAGAIALPASVPLASAKAGWIESLGCRPLVLGHKKLVLRETLDLTFRHGSRIAGCILRASKAMRGPIIKIGADARGIYIENTRLESNELCRDGVLITPP